MRPTDLQRKVMRAATERDPKWRRIDHQLVEAATILAQRGYVTVKPIGDGAFEVELTERAPRWCRGWRRYPPLRP